MGLALLAREMAGQGEEEQPRACSAPTVRASSKAEGRGKPAGGADGSAPLAHHVPEQPASPLPSTRHGGGCDPRGRRAEAPLARQGYH